MRALNVLSKVISLSAISTLAGLGSRYAGLETEPEMSDLMNEVASKVPAKWRQISIQLGLTPSDQECFMASTPNDPIRPVFHFCFPGLEELSNQAIHMVHCDQSTRGTSS